MALFICGDLYKLLKSLMKRFVKPAVMKDITSAAKLASVAVWFQVHYKVQQFA